jgi:hypothetical protein
MLSALIVFPRYPNTEKMAKSKKSARKLSQTYLFASKGLGPGIASGCPSALRSYFRIIALIWR